ncbi:helix-turn-helix domain-containing protein [Streptomyces sp. P6-2-1]|uniref:helix-turn-helix domain-containing protein n=1 Tax=Streptomyces sp. P6-2-1 TaxID=3422591 RepID=UPI003D360559
MLHATTDTVARHAAALLHQAYGTTPPTGDLLTTVACLQRALTVVEGATVARARALHETHATVAAHLSVSADHVRKKYDKKHLDRVLAPYTDPWNPTPVFAATDSEGPPGQEPSLPRAQECSERRAADRLRAALSHTMRRSAASQRAVAEAIRRHPSYVSRLLSGEKPLHWPHLRDFARVLGIAECLLLPLYNVAAGIEPPPETDPVACLRDYLAGLLLSCGHTPHPLGDALAPTAVREALHGPGVPDWAVHSNSPPPCSACPATCAPSGRPPTTTPSPRHAPRRPRGCTPSTSAETAMTSRTLAATAAAFHAFYDHNHFAHRDYAGALLPTDEAHILVTHVFTLLATDWPRVIGRPNPAAFAWDLFTHHIALRTGTPRTPAQDPALLYDTLHHSINTIATLTGTEPTLVGTLITATRR